MNKITPEQKKFLDDLIAKMGKQNNRSTQYPLFYVHEKTEVHVTSDADSDRIAYVDEDYSEIDEREDEEGHIWKPDLEDSFRDWTCPEIDGRIDEDEAIDKFNLHKVWIKEMDEPVVNVGPFLTEEAAQAHIDANHYHYRKPYIFVWSCWRNDELQEVMKILFTLAGKEIPSWYK